MLINFSEPEPDGFVAGDAVPCHLFMSEVDWIEPLGPVLRQDFPDAPRRDIWLTSPPVKAKPPAAPDNVETEAERSASILACLVSALAFFALLNVPLKSGFSGFVGLGVGLSAIVFVRSFYRVIK